MDFNRDNFFRGRSDYWVVSDFYFYSVDVYRWFLYWYNGGNE